MAIIYNNLAHVARHQGDDAGAVALLEQSLALQRRLGLTGRHHPVQPGRLGAAPGVRSARARTYLAEALRIGVRSGEQRGIVVGLGGLARTRGRGRTAGDRRAADRRVPRRCASERA